MIVATAGHVDHGKTALVGALTGVDTDRLPEEKRRGLSIDLGFAYQELGDNVSLGFVDVPGHEKFVRAMVAGVGAIDFALLVVAADDGPMPQTLEHLAILDLLAVERGAVALSKIDTVDKARRDSVAADLASLLSGTSLAAAPLFSVSAVTGEGVAALKAHLDWAARNLPPTTDRGHFRLAIDRHFSVPGSGLVVAGSIYNGRVAVGDRLRLLSGGALGPVVRVRGLHAQNRPADSAGRGVRCAVNIVGSDLAPEAIHRGDWLVDAAAAWSSDRLDVRLRLPAGAPAFTHWTPTHLHLGAADVLCRVALLEEESLAPRQEAWARLYAERGLAARRGDRFILRDTSARATLAGGWVVDPLPPRHGRATPRRLATLRALMPDDPAKALAAALDAAPDGFDLGAFLRARNLTAKEADALLRKTDLVTAGGGGEHWAIAPRHWRRLRAELVAAVDRWHDDFPTRQGASAEQLGRALPKRQAGVLVAVALADLAACGDVARSGAVFHRPRHRVRLAAEDARLWQDLEPLLRESGLRPPPLADMATAIGRSRRETEATLSHAAAMGLIVRVARNRFFTPQSLATLAGIGEGLAREENFTAAAFRDATGIGRNLTIDLLEFFDRARFTLRDGDRRRILMPAEALFGNAGGND